MCGRVHFTSSLLSNHISNTPIPRIVFDLVTKTESDEPIESNPSTVYTPLRIHPVVFVAFHYFVPE